MIKCSMKKLFLFLAVLSAIAAAAAAQTSASGQADAKPPQSASRKVDKAAAYYHYTLAHMY